MSPLGARTQFAMTDAPSRAIEAPADRASLARLTPRERAIYGTLLVVCTAMLGASVALRHAGNVWAFTGATAVACATAVVVFAPRHLRAYLEWDGPVALGGLIVGVVAIPVTHLAFDGFEVALPAIAAEATELYSALDAWPGRIAALPILIFVIFVEELVYRGVAQHFLQDLVPSESLRSRGMLVLMGTAIYVMPQLVTGSLVLVLLATGWGVLWTLQRLASGSLLASLVTHTTWSVGVFVLWPVA